MISLFKTALSGYNYSVEFNKSRVANKGKIRLVLPKNQARKIAYVFCLLVEFDTKKRSLKQFLDEYYFMPQPNASLALWTKDMIVTFKDVTEYLYLNGIETLLDDEDINYSLRRQVGEILENFNALIVRSTELGADTKRDLFVVLSAIENSLTPTKADAPQRACNRTAPYGKRNRNSAAVFALHDRAEKRADGCRPHLTRAYSLIAKNFRTPIICLGVFLFKL